jgi:hypothetical protein
MSSYFYLQYLFSGADPRYVLVSRPSVSGWADPFVCTNRPTSGTGSLISGHYDNTLTDGCTRPHIFMAPAVPSHCLKLQKFIIFNRNFYLFLIALRTKLLFCREIHIRCNNDKQSKLLFFRENGETCFAFAP